MNDNKDEIIARALQEDLEEEIAGYEMLPKFDVTDEYDNKVLSKLKKTDKSRNIRDIIIELSAAAAGFAVIAGTVFAVYRFNKEDITNPNSSGVILSTSSGSSTPIKISEYYSISADMSNFDKYDQSYGNVKKTLYTAKDLSRGVVFYQGKDKKAFDLPFIYNGRPNDNYDDYTITFGGLLVKPEFFSFWGDVKVNEDWHIYPA